MQTFSVNYEMTAVFPDGFHLMSQDERNRMSMPFDGEWAGFSDPDRHMVVTIGWKQVNRLSAMLVDAPSLADKMNKQIRQSLLHYGYVPGEFEQRQVASLTAYGFGYEYQAQDTPMYGSSYVMKKDKMIYYFHCYTRSALKEENVPLWRDILSGVWV